LKKFKALTDGLAILLAVLIIIFLAANYVKYKPDTQKVEKGISKLYQFFDNTQTNRDYMRLAILLCLSSAVSMIFRKRPEISVLTSLSVFAYVINMLFNKQLSEHPMVVTILSLCHCIGCLIYCAYRDRFEDKHHLSNASVLCSAGSLGLTAYILTFLLKYDSVREMGEKIAESGISLSHKIRFDTTFVSLIYEKLINSGVDEARDLSLSIAYDVKVSSLKNYFLSSLEPEELKSYLFLLIFILVPTVLIVIMRKKLRFIPVVLSAIPCVYAIIAVHAGKLSALPLSITVMTVATFLCSYAQFDQYGRGHDSAYAPEGERTDEEGETEADVEDEQEVFYS